MRHFATPELKYKQKSGKRKVKLYLGNKCKVKKVEKTFNE